MKKTIKQFFITTGVMTLVLGSLFFGALYKYHLWYEAKIEAQQAHDNVVWKEGYEVGRYDELVYQDEESQRAKTEIEDRKWVALSTNPEIPRLLKLYFKDYETSRVIYAIARAESSGRQIAVNKNTNGTTDAGYLQVNSIHKNAGETDQQFVARMHILEENIKLAAKVYYERASWDKTGFNAWTMYKNGTYKQYLK